MSDEFLTGVAIAIVTALGAWFVANAKVKADAKRAEADRQAVIAQAARDREKDLSGATWTQANEWLVRLDNEVKALRQELSTLGVENRSLRAENADQQSLIAEVAEYIEVTDVWLAGGAKPPPPNKPKRILDHVEQVRRKYNREP